MPGPTLTPPLQVIFITEYVSSGSLKQFLKKTKKNHKAMNARVGDPPLTPAACVGHPGSPSRRLGTGLLVLWMGPQAANRLGMEGDLGGGAARIPASFLPLLSPRQAWKRWCTQILSALR